MVHTFASTGHYPWCSVLLLFRGLYSSLRYRHWKKSQAPDWHVNTSLYCIHKKMLSWDRRKYEDWAPCITTIRVTFIFCIIGFCLLCVRHPLEGWFSFVLLKCWRRRGLGTSETCSLGAVHSVVLTQCSSKQFITVFRTESWWYRVRSGGTTLTKVKFTLQSVKNLKEGKKIK